MKKTLANILMLCIVLSSILLLSSCEKNEFTSMIPGLNGTIDLIEELTHKHKIVLIEQVEATCSNAGTKAYYACEGCDMLFADANGEMIISSPDLIEKLAHAYDDDYDAECNLCGNIRTAKCRHSNVESLASKDATCTETGLTAGEKCLDCGATITAQETISALDHQYDNDTDTTCNRTGCDHERCLHRNTEVAGEATESTCSVHGLTAGSKCSDCGEILVAQEKLPLKDHTEVATDAVDAGCITVGHKAGSHCSVCQTTIKTPETISATGHSWNGLNCAKCGAYKVEAESADIVTDIDRLGAGMQSGKTPEDTNYPSGDGYVYYLSDEGNATLTYYVNSDKDGKAVISFRMGLTRFEYTADMLFTLTVNGQKYDYYPSAIFPLYEQAGVIIYFGWYEIEVAEVDLKEGNNTIVLTRNTNGMNFDYITVRSTNGATLSAGYQEDSGDSDTIKQSFVAGTDTDPFISSNGGSTDSTLKTESGVGTYYGNASGKTFTYTMNVNVEEATEVTLIIRCAKRYGPYTYNELFGGLTVNGSTDGVTFTDKTIQWGTTSAAWGSFKDYALATITLEKGTNTIEFTVITSCNVEAVIIESTIPVALNKQ